MDKNIHPIFLWSKIEFCKWYETAKTPPPDGTIVLTAHPERAGQLGVNLELSSYDDGTSKWEGLKYCPKYWMRVPFIPEFVEFLNEAKKFRTESRQNVDHLDEGIRQWEMLNGNL